MSARHLAGYLLMTLGLALLAAALLAQLQVWSASPARIGVLSGLGAACVGFGLATRIWDTCETGTSAQRRRYLREFTPPMVAYVLVLFASLWLLKRLPEPGVVRALVAVAPVLPIAIALRAIVRHIRAIDELQQRIELESVSIATAAVSMVYLAGGFLQLAGVINLHAGMAMIWVFPLVCAIYGVAKAIVARRYK